MNISFDEIFNAMKPCPWKVIEYVFTMSKGEHPSCFHNGDIEKLFDFDSTISSIVQMLIEPKAFFPQKMDSTLKFVAAIPKHSQRKGAIYLIQENPDVLERIADCNLDDPVFSKCEEVRIGECLCGDVAKTKKPVTGKCINSNCRIRSQALFPHSHYCYPIVNSEKELLGVLNIYLEESHEKDEKEEELLCKIVEIIGWFIEYKRQEREANKIKHRMFSALSKMTLRREVTTQIVEENNRLLENINSKIGKAVQEVEDRKLKKDLLNSMKKITKIGVSNHNLACFMEEGDITIRNNEVIPVVETALNNLSDQLKALNVNIIKRFEPQTTAYFRASMIEQVVDTILQNAIDQFKLQQKMHHEIIIEIKTEDYAEIRITDNGGGIKADVIKRIFDPIFTTKTVGEGKLGLSLFMARQIVEEHNGLIFCKSTENKTTFTIKLPLT